MADEPAHEPAIQPALRLQSTAFPAYTVPTLSPSFRVDEGYSDDTRSQSDKEIVPDNAMMLPDWVLAQNEANRAGKCLASVVVPEVCSQSVVSPPAHQTPPRP